MSGKKGLVNGNNCDAFLLSFNKILKTLCQDWVSNTSPHASSRTPVYDSELS